MTVLALVAVLLVGQPDAAPSDLHIIPDLPGLLPSPAASPDVERDPPIAAPSGDIDDHWLEIARCESGNWHDGGETFSGPIRWDWGVPDMELPPWGTDLHHGGLQWAPSTWTWLAPIVLGDDAPARAYDATPSQEVAVAEHYVRLEQEAGRGGWGPWPTCGPMVGLPT